MFKRRSLRGGWIIRMRNSEWCRKLVPKMRWSTSEGAVSDFERRWWFDKSDIRWRACVVTMRRLNGYKVTEIWWLSGIENFVREQNNFIWYVVRAVDFIQRKGNVSGWTVERSVQLGTEVAYWTIHWQTKLQSVKSRTGQLVDKEFSLNHIKITLYLITKPNPNASPKLSNINSI